MRLRPIGLMTVALAAVLTLVGGLDGAAERLAGSGTRRIDGRSVWASTTPSALDGCRSAAARDVTKCFFGVMRRRGASSEAISFSQRIEPKNGDVGFMSSFKVYGPVDVGQVTFPFRANSNDQTVLLNGRPSILFADDIGEDGRRALEKDTAYRQIKARHPNITTWIGASLLREERLSRGGQRFLFVIPMGEFHAEAGRWEATLAFDFDADGRFLGRKLISVTTNPSG